jgi:hypothetical protein
VGRSLLLHAEIEVKESHRCRKLPLWVSRSCKPDDKWVIRAFKIFGRQVEASN